MTASWYANERDPGWTSEPASGEAWRFHRSLDGYAPTPLVELPELARQLDVGRVFAKDESSRLGLPAFNALGASWVVHRVLEARDSDASVTIVTATDGNHGRAVARCARMRGQRSTVVIPGGVHPEAVEAIADEGAEVIRVDGSYDDAVAAAAGIAEKPEHVLVQNTA